jgi:hypothetical protein
MALTLAVSVLMVSAGESASGFGACGTASNSLRLLIIRRAGLHGNQRRHQDNGAGKQR